MSHCFLRADWAAAIVISALERPAQEGFRPAPAVAVRQRAAAPVAVELPIQAAAAVPAAAEWAIAVELAVAPVAVELPIQLAAAE
jgi:hypothetical protein